MNSSKLTGLPLLLFLFFIGCAPRQDKPIGSHASVTATQQEVSKGSKPDPETAKVIRQLAGAAAGMADEEFKVYLGGGATPDPARLTNQPLTSFITCIRVIDFPDGAYVDRMAEFRFRSKTPNPNKLVKLLKPSESLDCWTALHPQYITNVTCNSDDTSATGVISFNAEVYAGHVHYSARKANETWQINEFSFPVRDWRFVREKDGTWKWFDHFGHIQTDRKLSAQDIVCEVLLDDEPLPVGDVVFWMTDYPEIYFSAQMPRLRSHKTFKVSVPPGKYVVTFRSKGPHDEKYHRRSKSDLTVEVAEGQAELTLKIKSAQE